MKWVFKTNEKQREHLFDITMKMLEDGFPDTFVEEAMHLGMEYEEVYDLFALWEKETDDFLKAELATCIQEAIDKEDYESNKD